MTADLRSKSNEWTTFYKILHQYIFAAYIMMLTVFSNEQIRNERMAFK